ncbi:ATPase ASNA1 homolog [Bolinopsis microptera]|uniref:ATPase ASNA1 homolog n=1 Tax=Bolinopsis microptera TaxID=2820187 RepID=UPI003079F554
MEQHFEYEANIKNILEQNELKWIFVGGKGGVGKTSVSCSLAIQLAKLHSSVLLISTDPAHNIADSFEQQFTRTPTQVKGVDNLMAMEVDSSPPEESIEEIFADPENEQQNLMKNVMKDVVGNLPGLDELIALVNIFKIVDQHQFDVVVFDTAPTGHTLRLLSIPRSIDKVLRQLIQMKSWVGGLVNAMSGSLGVNASVNMDMMDELLPVIERLNKELKDPDITTFVCVCIPEFLSLYETERLIQKLTALDIDTHNVVVNQVVYPDKTEEGKISCGLCSSRSKMQTKYLEQIGDLYEDFHVIKMPLMALEVKGTKILKRFGEFLVSPPDMANKSVHDLVVDL